MASTLGYTVKRVGRYHTIKEMDSIRIYDRTHWYRWSRQFDKGSNGGSQIDFLRVFCNMEVKEAVFWLLDFAGYGRNDQVMESNIRVVEVKKQEKKEFVLPEAACNNNYLYSYLTQERGLSRAVVDYFIQHELIYQSKQYHNIVFKGNDKAGITRFANRRGVFDKNGKAFKCDVAGNDKRYGFNIWNSSSKEVFVFEGAIDLMSYIDITGGFDSNMIALGMIADAPLETFLKEHKQICNVIFCLDNDVPGRKATKELCDKYYGLGFNVEDSPPPKGFKDCNEWLFSMKNSGGKTRVQVVQNRRSFYREVGQFKGAVKRK